MKRMVLLLAGVVLSSSVFGESTGVAAILERQNGKAFQLKLTGNTGEFLTARLENAPQDTKYAVDDIKSLQFPVTVDLFDLDAKFAAANYKDIIEQLEPKLTPCFDYLAFRNNVESAASMLLKAYAWDGEYAKADDLARRLLENKNPAVIKQAQFYQIISYIGLDRLDDAEKLRLELKNPPEKIYLKAYIERAKKQPKEAIQTAIELIADYGNDMDWMPQTEWLCAGLYLDMGMTNSAVSVAHQVSVFYEGMNVGKEAEQLQAELQVVNGKPE